MSRQGKCFNSWFLSQVGDPGFSKQNASVRPGAGKFSLGNVKMKQFQEGNVSVPPWPQLETFPLLAVPPEGAGEGQGEEGGRTKPPSLHPQRFHGSSHNPHYWKK